MSKPIMPVHITLAPDTTQPSATHISCTFKPERGAPLRAHEAVALDMLNALSRSPGVSGVTYHTTPGATIDAATALAGERNVLAQLLREADEVLATIEGPECETDGGQALASLRTRIAMAVIRAEYRPADLLSVEG